MMCALWRWISTDSSSSRTHPLPLSYPLRAEEMPAGSSDSECCARTRSQAGPPLQSPDTRQRVTEGKCHRHVGIVHSTIELAH